jgi:hypothetical protein
VKTGQTQTHKMRDAITRRTLAEIPAIRKQLRDEFKDLLNVVDPKPKAKRSVTRFFARWTTKRD